MRKFLRDLSAVFILCVVLEAHAAAAETEMKAYRNEEHHFSMSIPAYMEYDASTDAPVVMAAHAPDHGLRLAVVAPEPLADDITLDSPVLRLYPEGDDRIWTDRAKCVEREIQHMPKYDALFQDVVFASPYWGDFGYKQSLSAMFIVDHRLYWLIAFLDDRDFEKYNGYFGDVLHTFESFSAEPVPAAQSEKKLTAHDLKELLVFPGGRAAAPPALELHPVTFTDHGTMLTMHLPQMADFKEDEAVSKKFGFSVHDFISVDGFLGFGVRIHHIVHGHDAAERGVCPALDESVKNIIDLAKKQHKYAGLSRNEPLVVDGNPARRLSYSHTSDGRTYAEEVLVITSGREEWWVALVHLTDKKWIDGRIEDILRSVKLGKAAAE